MTPKTAESGLLLAAIAGVVLASGCAGNYQDMQQQAVASRAIPPPCKEKAPLVESRDGKVSKAIPIVPIRPQYPSEAIYHKIEGVVFLRFTIEADGTTCDASVVYSNPPGIFEFASLKALAASKFKPKTVNRVPVPSIASFTYTYLVSSIARDKKAITVPVTVTSAPGYPASAYLAHIGGFVTFDFTVDEHGHPHDPVVLDSEPPGIFDEAATKALMRTKFKIKRVDGKPVSYHAKFTYRFHPEPRS